MKYILSLILLFTSISTFAVNLKVAVLAPEGTSWAKKLKEFSKTVESKTKGAVKFTIYFGGAQGDEPDVLRKMRVGQLHGSIFTGKTLGELSGDIRVLEVPFAFGADASKASQTLKKLTPMYNQQLEKKGFKNLGFFELGMVHLISTKKVQKFDDLGGLKIWLWEGDPLVGALSKTMSLVSVPLPITDVLSSLSTGVIQGAYAPPTGIVALQWGTKVKYLLDTPLAFSVASFLMSKRAWKRVPAKWKKVVEEEAQKASEAMAESVRKDNEKSLQALKLTGVEFVSLKGGEEKRMPEIREKVVSKLKGKLFSDKIWKSVIAN